MTKVVIFKSPVRFGGQRYPAGTEMELEDGVIKSLPSDVYSIKAPEPVAAVDPAPTTSVESKAADKAK